MKFNIETKNTLSFEQMKNIVDNITYKPEWKINISRGYIFDFEAILSIETPSQPDASGIRPGISPIVTTTSLGPCYTEDEFLHLIVDSIRRLELHEMEEWLKFENKWLKNPHPGHTEYEKNKYQWGKK